MTNKLIRRLDKRLITARYYLYYPILKKKIKEIMAFGEGDIGLDEGDQEERALPGFKKYTATGYHRFMFSRYLFSIPYIKNKNVLEVGAGLGWGAYLVSQYPAKLLCVDVDTDAVKFAQETWTKGSFEYRPVLTDEIRKENKTFDTILCYEVIEHLTDEQGAKLIEDFSALLNPGGTLIMSSIFPTSRAQAEEGEKDNKFHLHIFTEQEMRELFEKNNFTPPRIYSHMLIHTTRR